MLIPFEFNAHNSFPFAHWNDSGLRSDYNRMCTHASLVCTLFIYLASNETMMSQIKWDFTCALSKKAQKKNNKIKFYDLYHIVQITASLISRNGKKYAEKERHKIKHMYSFSKAQKPSFFPVLFRRLQSALR